MLSPFPYLLQSTEHSHIRTYVCRRTHKMLQCHAARLLLCATSKRTLAYIGGVSFHGNVVTYFLCMQLAILRVLGKSITCRWVAVKRIVRYLKGVYIQSWTYLQTPEELRICGIF